jgi:hypothetical protein
MFTFLAFILGGVIGWNVCKSHNEDNMPTILSQKELEEYDKTIKQIETEVGASFRRNFGVSGTIFRRPSGREEAKPAVVIKLEAFIEMTSLKYFSKVDDEIFKDYLEENDLPDGDFEVVLDHYSQIALAKYDSERQEAFDNLMNEVKSG